MAETRDDPYGLAVRPETFARQLEILGQHHEIVPLGRLVDALPRGAYPDGAVAISFDDGYEDNLSQAVPIAAGLPLTVFVTVEPVLDGGRFWWDEIAALDPPSRDDLHTRLKGLPRSERLARIAALGLRDGVDRGRPLTVDELCDLASRPGVEIGAHTLSHPCLALLSPGEQERELADGRTRLESLLGSAVTLLAYPFGKPADVSPQTARLAQGAGYRAAFTSVPRSVVRGSPLHGLPRLTVHEGPAEALVERVRACREAVR